MTSRLSAKERRVHLYYGFRPPCRLVDAPLAGLNQRLRNGSPIGFPIASKRRVQSRKRNRSGEKLVYEALLSCRLRNDREFFRMEFMLAAHLTHTAISDPIERMPLSISRPPFGALRISASRQKGG
jgi:hypothetical protein